MKFKLHYKKRDKIFDQFRLWPIVHYFAKRRYKNNPNDPKAIRWLEITEENLGKTKIKSKNLDINSFDLRDYYEGLNRVQKYNYDILRLNRLVDKVESTKTLEAFLYSALGKFEFEKESGNEVSSIKHHLRYLLYKHCYEDHLNANIELKKFILSTEEDNNDINKIEFCKISGSSVIEASSEGFSKNISTKAKRKNIVVISESAEALYNSLPSLPNNSNISAYYFNADNYESAESTELNFSVEVRNFFVDLIGLDSDMDRESI